MLESKKKYIDALLESSGLGLKMSGIRDLVDDCVETYLNLHAKYRSMGGGVEDDEVLAKLEEMLTNAFTKQFIWHLHRSQEYKDRVAFYIEQRG